LFLNNKIALCLVLCLAAAAAGAADYPTKPIRFVVGFTPGGSSDTVAWVVGQQLAERVGQQVVVDNRGGASGTIAAQIVAGSLPDGYTLLLATPGPMTIAPALNRKMPYDPERDFAPITQIASTSAILLVRPDGPRSVRELIAAAKAAPGKLNYASSGYGSSNHLAAELFSAMAGVTMVQVPYKGSGQTMPALISGEVQLLFGPIVPALPMMQSGRLRALGITGARRTPAAPEVPTIAEAGVPGYEVDSWYGVAAPAKTPRAILARLTRELTDIVKRPDVRERLLREGTDPVGNTPEAFAQYMRAERVKWRKLAETAHIKPD
jgi:tripartite-type tricarboxylate transporter receptor subunit TctC